jgi:microsomal epoxide hydrolase
MLVRGSQRIPIVILLMLVSVSVCAAKPHNGFFQTTDGVKLHYLEAGKGQVIIFIPGWTMPAEIWRSQIEYFARDHRVIAFDPRSQGRSARPTEGHYPERRAQDLKELIDHLEVNDAVVVGWSLAVPELLTYVELFGTKNIEGFVFVDGFIPGDADPQFESGIRAWLKSAQMDRKKFTDEFVRSMFRTKRPEAEIQRIVDASNSTPTNSAVLLILNTVGNKQLILSKIDKPLLHIQTTALGKQSEMVKKLLPLARTEIYANTGHALFVDDPERFNHDLENFLRSLRNGQ